MKNLSRYRGCLIGGAAGDALGYAVEFSREEEIFAQYGERGITEYDLMNGKALISDDTQMTLFTANGLLYETTRRQTGREAYPYARSVGLCYRDWLRTQSGRYGREKPECAWLNNVPELNKPRAPGGTCLGALSSDRLGTVATPLNRSKGCGGVMRVAPVGLYFEESEALPGDRIDLLGAEAAALTHGHELGYLPAAMLVHIVRLLAHSDMSVAEAVQDAEKAVSRLFGNAACLPDLLRLIDRAVSLAAEKEIDDLDAIRELGEGWVAEETLAIAVYCALKYEDDFEEALIAAVNHGGDSDSTGAVTGNILGAKLGLEGIPQKFLTSLEVKEIILEMADDLYRDCPPCENGICSDPVWAAKYVAHTYPEARTEA